MSSTDKAVQAQWYGMEEPAIDAHLGDIFNWYEAMTDDKEARQYLVEFYETVNEDHARKIRLLPDEWIPRTAAWYARLSIRGFELPDEKFEYMEALLERSFRYIRDDGESRHTALAASRNVQFFIREKGRELAGELEGMIDDGLPDDFSLVDYLKSKGVSRPVAQQVLDRFRPRADEIISALAGDIEGYERYNQEELELLAISYQTMVDETEQYIGDSSDTLRKPRKKKPPTRAKVMKQLRFLESHGKIKSIDPMKILGAHQLWTYHVKRKILTVYRAEDDTGLGISRSSITKADSVRSFGKKIGRHTEKWLARVLEDGKVKLRSLLDEDVIGRRIPPSRITRDTLLLRVL